jgi:hypothetical protein
MTLTERSITQLTFSRLASVLAFLCAFTVLPLPQISGLARAETCESECPCEEDGENLEEELVVSASTRRRLHNRCHDVCQFYGVNVPLRQFSSHGNSPQATVGHFLANGLRAPLVI